MTNANAAQTIDADFSIFSQGTGPSAEIIPFSPEVAQATRVANHIDTREAWLNAAIDGLREMFELVEKPLPAKILVSIGFPSTGRAKRVVVEEGESLAGRLAEYHFPQDGNESGQIYITPQLGETIAKYGDDRSEKLSIEVVILGVLVHELCHGSAGFDAKHGPKFKEVADAIGLTGKMTAALPGEKLNEGLKILATQLGPIPHETLIAGKTQVKKQTTRLIRVESTCLGDESGKRYNANMSQKWIDEAGAPICPTALRHYLEHAIETGEKISAAAMLDALDSFRMVVVERKKSKDAQDAPEAPEGDESETE
jgi:hypothetical protein